MKTKNGFTLFELLVSISIIAIMIAIASFSYSSAQKKARDAKRVQDISAIQKAAEQYYATNGSVYSDTLSTWGGILQMVPTEPKSGWTAYTYAPYTVAGVDYCACAHLESSVTAGNSGAGCVGFGTGAGYYCVRNQQ